MVFPFTISANLVLNLKHEDFTINIVTSHNYGQILIEHASRDISKIIKNSRHKGMSSRGFLKKVENPPKTKNYRSAPKVESFNQA